MKWRRLTLRVDAPDVEIASALLAQATGAAVALDEPLDGGRPAVSAYVPATHFSSASGSLDGRLGAARRCGLLRTARKSTATIADEQWATSWKRYYEPSLLAKGSWIVPSWRSRSFRPPKGSHIIILDPGMAFGTGQHPTTKMAAAFLTPLVRAGEPAIDVGSGSGILSIVAGFAGANVFACDVDPLAVQATRANLRRNGVRGAKVVRGSGIPASFPQGPLVVANITADVLMGLASQFSRKLVAGGSLVTSGVTRGRKREVLDSFRAAGLRMLDERRSGEWVAFVHVKERAR